MALTVRRARVLLIVLVGLASSTAVVLQAPPAAADVLEVTRRTDPAPNGCRPNDCSLREAVIAANNRPGPDRIELRSQSYEMQRAGTGEDAGATGDFDITSNVTIVGRGPGNTSVVGNLVDRLFHVLPGGNATFKGLTLYGGSADLVPAVGSGGAVLNQGTARLVKTKVQNNQAESGSGGGIANTGNLTIANSKLIGNGIDSCCGGALHTSGGEVTMKGSTVANNGGGCCGGGIYSTAGAEIKILRSTFRNNDLDGCCGGAIYNQGESHIVIKKSRFVGHDLTGCCGGTIYNQGGSSVRMDRTKILRSHVGGCCGGALYSQNEDTRLRLTRSTIDGSRVGGCCGGAIYNQDDSNMRILRTKITDNEAASSGGAIYNQDTAPLLIRFSLIRNNSVGEAMGNDGGGIYSQTTGQGHIEVRDSTIAGNSAYRGAGIYSTANMVLTNVTLSNNVAVAQGGGLYTDTDGTAFLSHVTVTGNEGGTVGTGIFNEGGPMDIFRSIVAGNESPDDCNLPQSSSKNLDEDAECFNGASAIHAPPRLKPLDNYGGPTPTHALRATSEAVDAAGSAACPPPAKDQRGVRRPQNGDGQGGARCDLGAFELKR